MAYEDFQVGDPVWAKMKGYPPWPAKVVDPPSLSKAPKNKKAHYVYFFGSDNFAWILDENISPHSDNMLNTLAKKKSGPYQSAIDDLLAYSKTHKKEKQNPSKIKRDKFENNVKKSSMKVVKVIQDARKKHERKVFGKHDRKDSSNKFPQRKFKKRPISDVNGESSADSTSKFAKFDYFDCSSTNKDESNSAHIVRSEVKNIKPSELKFGFIGLGVMGKQIVRTLIDTGHKVSVWNKTLSQCDYFVKLGANKAHSPAELIVECDVTFCCVADPAASKAVIFGEQGVLKGLDDAQSLGLEKKGYVEMTSIDPVTSLGISEAIAMKRGKYLEAPLCGTSEDAEIGRLLVLASGDKELFEQCQSCFHAIGKNAYFLSCDVGDGTRMGLILSMLSGTICAALAEAMVLVERLKLQKENFLACLSEGPLKSRTIVEKARMMASMSFRQVTALKHIQKDIDLSLLMGNDFSQHMPVTAAANEVYKHGRLSKYSNEDMSAVYKVAKY